ncbi:MAG: DsbA family protein [Rhodospirillaceae bacterium]|jgi:protein-disulfide isomerase
MIRMLSKTLPAVALALALGMPFISHAVDAEMQRDANERAARLAFDLRNDPGTPVIGNPNGDVTVIEFFDYQCPYCKAAEPRLRELVKRDGNIKFVIKDFPILSAVSVVASKAALAADLQGKHEVFHNALMDHRGQLDEDRVFKIAGTVGLDVAKLREDMQSPAVTDQLIENFNLARKLKISVVPGYIVDDKVLSGLSSDTVTSAINFDQEVAEARAR